MYKSLVIIGNGPSMCGFDFSILNNHTTVGMNAAYRYWKRINWYPTYYCCLDIQVINTHHKNIKALLDDNLVKKIFIRAHFFNYYPDLKNDPRILIFENLKNNSLFFKSSNPNTITTGGTVCRFGMYLGYNKLYLIGIDCKYTEIIPEAKKISNIKLQIVKTPIFNPNYFFDDYQQVGDIYHIPNPHGNIHLNIFKILRNDIKKYKMCIEVINCNKKSALYEQQIFPYQELESILN